MKNGPIVALVRWIAAISALCAIVAVYHLWLRVNPTTVALTLLLLVLALAARWGLRFAVVTSIAAAALFNYFFLPPIGTFTIADTQNWVALLAFLGTSIVASQLSNRIQAEAERAKAGKREVEVLYQLSRELLQTQNVAELLNALPSCVQAATSASAVALYLSQEEKLYFSEGHEDNLAGVDLQAAAQLPQIMVADSDRWSIIPLRVGVKPRGALLLKIASLSAPTLEALGSVASIAIDRAEALENVARSEAAKKSERLRAALLDSITHELRTPLTAIKASATALISTDSMTPANSKEMLAVIDEESDRLNHLISQAMEMVQLDSHEVYMELSPQPIAELIANARQTSASTLAGHPLKVRLPPQIQRVLADPVWIERVLSNLLENAAKYSPSNAPVTVTAEQRGDAVAISIADRGAGIDLAERQLVFDKFYRGQRQRDRVSGTGMGLAICRAIVEAHHGTIAVTSQPGQGSIFTFTLPAA